MTKTPPLDDFLIDEFKAQAAIARQKAAYVDTVNDFQKQAPWSDPYACNPFPSICK